MSLADGNQCKHALPDNDDSFGYSSDFYVVDGFDESAGGNYSATEEEFAGSSETNGDHSEDSDEPATNVPNGGLNGDLFSMEEEVQVDLLRTLQKLKCLMIAYNELMKWAVLSDHAPKDIHSTTFFPTALAKLLSTSYVIVWVTMVFLPSSNLPPVL